MPHLPRHGLCSPQASAPAACLSERRSGGRPGSQFLRWQGHRQQSQLGSEVLPSLFPDFWKCSCLALLDRRDGGERIHPRQCRPPPDLPLRGEGGALNDRTDAQAVDPRIVHCAGIDRGAASAAEGVEAFVAAFGSLDISLRCAPKHQMLGGCRDVHAKSRPRERLAIGAVANVERIGIDLRLEGDLAAMTTSVDLHSFPREYCARFIFRSSQIGYGAAPGGPSSQATERSRPPDPPKTKSFRILRGWDAAPLCG